MYEVEIVNDTDGYIRSIIELLRSYAKDSYAKEHVAPLVAQKSTLPNHLYEDMGFASRAEMHTYMSEHFPNLAAKKPKEIRWKKYLYDLIGKRAPACFNCPDEDLCHSCDKLN